MRDMESSYGKLKLFAEFQKIFGRAANTNRCIFCVKGVVYMELNQNIYRLRKEKGLSQEKLAEKINVSRQTISNWELGETSPNPEQLILLSKVFQKSIDELVGNEMMDSQPEETKEREKTVKPVYGIYGGFAVLCGAVAGVWAFTANRFNFHEQQMIILGGVVIGLGLGAVCHGMLRYVDRR